MDGKNNRQDGFTLLEVVLAMSLFVILCVPLVTVLGTTRTELQKEQALARLQAELTGFETMIRRDIYSAQRVENTPGGIVVYKANGERMRFYYAGERLYRSVVAGSDHVGNNPILASIKSLASDVQDGGRLWHMKGILSSQGHELPFEYLFFMPLSE